MKDQDALFDLCKQVYEKTGWDFKEDDPHYTKYRRNKHGEYDLKDEAAHYIGLDNLKLSFIPLYSSDYLLEKLLPITYSIQVYRRQTGLIDLMWMPQKPMYDDVVSDTPLKALLKLTLALSEAGEL